jgi:hypothetical protein
MPISRSQIYRELGIASQSLVIAIEQLQIAQAEKWPPQNDTIERIAIAQHQILSLRKEFI